MLLPLAIPFSCLFLLVSAGPTAKSGACNLPITTDPISGISGLEKGNLTQTDSKDGISLICAAANKDKAIIAVYISGVEVKPSLSARLMSEMSKGGSALTESFGCDEASGYYIEENSHNKDRRHGIYHYYCFNTPVDGSGKVKDTLLNHLRKTLSSYRAKKYGK